MRTTQASLFPSTPVIILNQTSKTKPHLYIHKKMLVFLFIIIIAASFTVYSLRG